MTFSDLASLMIVVIRVRKAVSFAGIAHFTADLAERFHFDGSFSHLIARSTLALYSAIFLGSLRDGSVSERYLLTLD